MEKIVSLKEKGLNPSQISKLTNIPRGTVRDVCKKYADVAQLAEARVSKTRCYRFESCGQHYAYVLGLYLGDGYICKSRSTYRLRIYLDKKYPSIISETVQRLGYIFPEQKIGIGDNDGFVNVGVYANHLPEVFPQHGPGRKHNRTIKLKRWQKKILKENPRDFLRGLIHSDGCKDLNHVNGKEYPRYSFSNRSLEIIEIFLWACNLLGISATTSIREHKSSSVYIATRKNVQFMDTFIGNK